MTDIDAADRRPPARVAPWWRFGMVWFVLSGPLIVVLAGIATMAIAFRHADAALVETAVPQASVDRAAPTAPALQARNHAATPTRRGQP
jgi:hypothetical protein